MAHILAMHGIDYILADVLGMIANAFDGPHHPHGIERAADGARILHHEGDALTVDRLVLLSNTLARIRSRSSLKRLEM